MLILGVTIGVLIAAVGVWIFFAVWTKKQQTHQQRILEDSAQKALGSVVQDLVKSAREQLTAEKRDITASVEKDLRAQSDTFKELAQTLRQDIAERQREIRGFEEDRNRKYGQIAQALTDYKDLTEELRGSTEQLKRVLASNQLRGSWGEMQAEKILEAAGMIAGQHYVKQQAMTEASELRPDFTIFLPNKLELYVDVKFPLNALQYAMASASKTEQAQHMQQFGLDLKQRIKEVNKYVLSKENCVDYVLLFVPSESVFEIINKNFAPIIDHSFSQQVILVSPHSFFAVVRTIQESYTHFYYERNLKEILHHLEDLLGNFERFKGEFSDVGKALQSAQTKYAQIEQTRYRQIAKASDKITQYQLESLEAPALPIPVTTDESVDSPSVYSP